MEYRRLGTGGTADKTADRNRSSLLHFNAFLESKGLGPFESLREDELCKVDLLREFGTFLCYHARNSRSDDLLMQNSAFGYMSGVKELIRVRFPDNSMFQESNQEWYTKLREGMGTAISSIRFLRFAQRGSVGRWVEEAPRAGGESCNWGTAGAGVL